MIIFLLFLVEIKLIVINVFEVVIGVDKYSMFFKLFLNCVYENLKLFIL